MKKLNFAILCIFFSTTLFAQLKVDQNGNIGMGTNWPNSGYRLHVKGNLLLTTHPNIPFYEFQFKVGNGWPGTEIGSTADKIAFWSSWQGYNKLYAEKFYKQSDLKLKTDLKQIRSPLKIISNLKGYSYYLKSEEKTKERKLEYGFVSQEVEKVLPDVVEEGKDVKLMDYDQIIPILVEAIKEQQKEIQALKLKLNQLEKGKR